MKKMLIVVDMQNDFISGVLGTQEAVAIEEQVAKKILDYQTLNWIVVFTRDTHDEDYLNTQEGKKLPVPHCIKGTKGWEITEKLNTGSSIIIDKKSFGSLELAEYAAGHAPKEIEMVGLCTDICVIANAIILKTRLPECIISVDAQCCAGVTPKSHQNALDAMKMCQINVINEEALK